MRNGGFVVEHERDGVVFVGDGGIVDVDEAVGRAGDELQLFLPGGEGHVLIGNWGGAGNVEAQGGYCVGVRVGVAVEELGFGEVLVGPVGGSV